MSTGSMFGYDHIITRLLPNLLALLNCANLHILAPHKTSLAGALLPVKTCGGWRLITSENFRWQMVKTRPGA